MSLSDSDFMYAGEQPADDDKRLFVRFTLEARLDRNASVEAGENKYKDVEFITIYIPGDKTLSVHRPVQPSDKQRFPLQYAAFRNTKGEALIGTPLSVWPAITPSQIRELEYFNVRTVEQLAALADGTAGAQMMGVNALRNAARAFIAARKEAEPLARLQEELQQRDYKIEALTDQVGKLMQRLDDERTDKRR